MIRVTHLLDDDGMGGIVRLLPDHIRRLSNGARHDIRVVRTDGLAPTDLDCDVAVVHFTANWAKLPFLVALRAIMGRRRIVVVEHSYTESYERECVRRPWRFHTMLQLAYAMADRVVAVSMTQGEWLRRTRTVRADALRVIPQGHDVSKLFGLEPPETSHTAPLRLVAYGRYARQKGFDVLIDAMRLIDPAIANLTLCGKGPDGEMLQDRAADLPHVNVYGSVSDVSELLVGFDAVVVPSRWEAFGLVAAEARAAARPVIASRVDGLIDQIDERNGILVDPNDSIALATAIRTLRARDIGALGTQGRASVASEWNATMDGWSALLRELAPRHYQPLPPRPEFAR